MPMPPRPIGAPALFALPPDTVPRWDPAADSPVRKVEAFSLIGDEPPGESVPPPGDPFLPAIPAMPGVPLAPRVTIGLLSLSIMELNWLDGIVAPGVLFDAGVRYVDGVLPVVELPIGVKLVGV